MKRIVKSLLVFVVGLVVSVSFIKVSAKEPAKVYLFYGEGCKYCAGAMTYLESLEEEYGDMFDVIKYEVWNNTENQALLEDVAAVFDDEIGGVPYIVIGEKTFAGYDLSGGFDADILEAIKKTYESNNSFDVMQKLGTTVKKSNALLYVVLAVVVILEIALLGFAKKNAYANETVKEEKKAEPKKEEVVVEKKETVKKTAAKKPAAKKATVKKATTAKEPAKKTTKTATKKTTAKKTTTKKTTKK
jgi:thiol-disulfide isomerase/thioredoxin